MAGVYSMAYERREFQLAVCAGIRGRGRVPHFDLTANCGSELTPIRREYYGRNRRSEREVIKRNTAGHVRQNGAAIFVDG